jgi:sugar lactone lactonase YvrE
MKALWLVLVLGCDSPRAIHKEELGGAPVHARIPEDFTTAQPYTGVVPVATNLMEGISSPESAIHDRTKDIYLVGSINGAPHAVDDNGYISRVAPDGTMLEERWIDGAKPDVTLHAPRGMAMDDTTLYVVDLDSVRLFDRTTGAPKATWPIPDPHFPNDIRVDVDGSVYVTETGIFLSGAGPIPTGDSVIWKFGQDGHPTALARGHELLGPNGIALTDDGIVVVSFLGTDVYRLVDGHPDPIATLPTGELDGLVELPDHSFLVTSWEGHCVYRVWLDGRYRDIMHGADLVGGASIEYDATRQQIVLPLVLASAVRIQPYAF